MKLPPGILDFPIAKRKPQAGDLLVAQPLLREPFFNHAVILLTEHNEDGSMGVVLNRPTIYHLSEALEGAKSEMTLFCGGPVSTDRLYFMHKSNELFPGGMEVRPGVWLGGDFDRALEVVNEGLFCDGVMRFFAGYSGWSAGQLDDELAEGTWAVADLPSDGEYIFSGESDKYWSRIVRTMGPQYANWTLHPSDLSWN